MGQDRAFTEKEIKFALTTIKDYSNNWHQTEID
jgi:hypothetical protein